MKHHVLMLGLGGIGQRHLRNLRELLGDDVRISAFRRRRERSQLSDQLSIVEGADVEVTYRVEVFDDLAAALHERPTIGIIANPTSEHVSSALTLIEAGCDVLIEKPLSDSTEDVERLILAARRSERVAFVGYQLRFHPCVVGLKAALENGKLGTLYGAHVEVAEYLPNFHPYEDYRRMYASRRELGGGVTLTQIHELDLIYLLFGLPERLWSVGEHLSSLEIDVEDSATSLFRYRREDGCSFAVTLHQDYLGRPPRRSFAVWGSEGRIVMNLRQGTLEFTDNEGRVERLVSAEEHPRNQLFLDELAHFLDCVRNRTRPLVTLDDARASLTLALNLRASQETGEVVSFADLNETPSSP